MAHLPRMHVELHHHLVLYEAPCVVLLCRLLAQHCIKQMGEYSLLIHEQHKVAGKDSLMVGSPDSSSTENAHFPSRMRKER